MEVCSKAFGYQRCEFCLRVEDLIFMYFAVGLILSIAIWNYYKWIYFEHMHPDNGKDVEWKQNIDVIMNWCTYK